MFIHIKSWCARRRISAVQVTGWTPSEVYQLLKTFTGHWDGWESPQLFPSLKCRTKGVWLDLQSAPLKRSGFFSVDSTECMNAGIAVQVTVMQTNMNSTFTVLLNSKGKKNKSVRNDRQPSSSLTLSTTTPSQTIHPRTDQRCLKPGRNDAVGFHSQSQRADTAVPATCVGYQWHPSQPPVWSEAEKLVWRWGWEIRYCRQICTLMPTPASCTQLSLWGEEEKWQSSTG